MFKERDVFHKINIERHNKALIIYLYKIIWLFLRKIDWRMNIRKLSVIIPAYNEANTITQIVCKVINAPLPDGVSKEIIVVDDCSTDSTAEQVKKMQHCHSDVQIAYTRLEKNKGKGFAVRMGIKLATGDAIVVQDADLEYDPNDYAGMLRLLVDDECRVVYGSRVLNKQNNYSYLSFHWGGRFISWVTSMLFGQRITDEPTCYKMFDASLLKSIYLTNDRFGFCPEVTAKILRKGILIKEVPISYSPRTKQEGKKIKWRDGVEALYLLIKYRWGDTEEPSRSKKSDEYRWAVRNILFFIVSLLFLMVLFRHYPAYHWVYADLLKKNMVQKIKYPHLTFDQKMLIKLGYDYQFLMYVRESTPKDAIILYPSSAAFHKKGSPFTQEIDNKIWATRFLYPRKLVLESEMKTNKYAGGITHVVVVNREVPSKLLLSPDSIPPHVVLSVHYSN